MRINKEIYKEIKKEVENDLRNYPFYLISIDMPGLGSAIRPDVVINKNMSPSDPVVKAVIDDQYKRTLVNAIDYVYDKLGEDSKEVIKFAYFRDDKTNQEVMDDLNIDKNKYYELKKKALYKFAMGLGYI